MDKTLTGTITLDQSGPENNGNDWVLHVPQSSKTEALDDLLSYSRYLLGVSYPLYRGAVSIFYSLSQPGLTFDELE